MYPIPAQNEINFVIDASKVASIQLFDISGRLIDTYIVSNDKAVINTSDLSNGVYSYSVIGKENVILNQGKFTVVK